MEEVVSQKILIIEAKKLNLFPSRDETLAYMEDIKSVKAKTKEEGIKIEEESEKSWQETLKGLIMTEDEYWKSEAIINGYQEALAIARVRSKPYWSTKSLTKNCPVGPTIRACDAL